MRTVDRILAVSDPHAENKKMQALLDKAEYDPEHDLLVLCGDMIDRGGENLAILETCRSLREKGAVLLKGNHEQFLEHALQEMLGGDAWRTSPSAELYQWYTYHGGRSMFQEIKELSPLVWLEMLDFVQSLPPCFTVGSFIFSHAGVNPQKPLAEHTENELLWMEADFPFREAYPGKTVIFGHTPTWLLYPYDGKKKDRKAAKVWYDTIHKDKVGIDCGGVFGGRLAALELPSYREFYV